MIDPASTAPIRPNSGAYGDELPSGSSRGPTRVPTKAPATNPASDKTPTMNPERDPCSAISAAKATMIQSMAVKAREATGSLGAE